MHIISTGQVPRKQQRDFKKCRRHYRFWRLYPQAPDGAQRHRYSPQMDGAFASFGGTLGSENVVADFLKFASSTSSVVDHFRPSDNKYDYCWEERWIRDGGYLKIVSPVTAAALANAGLKAGDISYCVMPTSFKGVASALAKKIGVTPAAKRTGCKRIAATKVLPRPC